MQVVVDGVIYQNQSRGGASRIYNEVLPRMCELDSSLHIRLLTQSLLQQSLPKHPRITTRRIPRVGRYLRPHRLYANIAPRVQRLVERAYRGAGTNQIWHSTYFTAPEKWRGKQVVVVLDMIYELFEDLFNQPCDQQIREQKRISILQADSVICISEATRQDVQKIYGITEEKTHVVPLAAAEFFRPVPIDDGGQRRMARPFLLYVGTRNHYKNFDSLITAYANWAGREDVDLVVVSEAPWTTQENRRLLELNIEARVRLLRNISDEDLRHLYNEALMFVYPSLYEGFGIPLLEAMACGCPVVASRIPSTVEVAGDCPVYFDPRSTSDLVAALDTAMAEGRLSKRTAAGIEWAKKYSWNKTARGILNVYSSL